ncbi:MAG: AAA family ATPase [Pseudomonadota bacterium]
MGRIIAVANQKGGVGKTTTAVNLAASLGALERKTLLVDIDPQGNASSGVGVGGPDVESKQIYHVLLGERPIREVIYETAIPHLKILPATADLIGFEIEALDLPERESLLKSALASVAEEYEYILIDCPPSLSLLTVNALTAADSVLVPLQCEYFALEGLGRLVGTIDLVARSLNPKLSLEGIVLTMFDRRNNLAHQVAKEVSDHFGPKLWETRIPRNVRLSEAPSFGKPILLYDIRSAGAQAYLALAEEFLRRGKTISVGGTNERAKESAGTRDLVADPGLSAGPTATD